MHRRWPTLPNEPPGKRPAGLPVSAAWQRLTPMERGAMLRRIERKRRDLDQLGDRYRLPDQFCQRFTYVSFKLEDLDIHENEVADALRSSARMRAFRGPRTLRIRNHVAILRSAELLVRRGHPLKADAVVRWYTSIGCGLSMTGMELASIRRLEHGLQRMNAPQLRIRPAIQDAAAMHWKLISDPLFPSFNGIIARLLLHYQLRRCNLPPVVFDPQLDRFDSQGEMDVLQRLAGLILEKYDDAV